ncbi:MAG: GMC family oxidoreductase [Alphaproteobacteria bacterium]|nr:GMC family oxidoreductase [Alphaproteobacteria bacterium]
MSGQRAVIVGSGFGGSVSALRLAEKGYAVTVLEQGPRFERGDFPKTTWDVRRFFWVPQLGFRGPFRMSFFRHVTILSGVGVGGGSLVYANTLPEPPDAFYGQGSWAGLADWKAELAPHYATAKRMLGATRRPDSAAGVTDEVLGEIAADMGRSEHYGATDVAVYFGEPGKRVPDPFFDGDGPDRVGCTLCGSCMTGCRIGAKNTLDRNYLWLAEKRGARILADTRVSAVRRRDAGYRVEAEGPDGPLVLEADLVVLSAGVLGTTELLLRMKADPGGLPALSGTVGRQVRTNSEALLGVVTDGSRDLTRGVAIGSILHTDAHSHIEPVRYGPGSGLFRLMALPHAPGDRLRKRLGASLRSAAARPGAFVRSLVVRDWSKATAILLYMRTVDGTLRFRLGAAGLATSPDTGALPTASIPEASALAERFAEKLGGFPVSMFTETLAAIPSTAHILGGACIGATAEDGVIGVDHQVHGYPGLYVCDGSAVSANPGVNPSLTITAMAERAMAGVPHATGGATGAAHEGMERTATPTR